MTTTAPTTTTVRTADRTGLAVEIHRVTKRFGGRTVVDDLSFTAAPGRVTGFLGPNGSGKSTTIKILLDLAAADGGHATFGGTRYRALPSPTTTVGAIVEPDAFHPGRTGRAHLRIVAEAAGIPITSVDEMLERFDLSDAARRRVGTYSLGMRQRLGLAQALLGEPGVLVLDEPGNGLDPHGVHELRELLRAHAARGGTVLLSSHLLAEIELLADDVVVIHRGRLVTAAPLDSLREQSTFVRTTDPVRLSAALEQRGANTTRHGDDGLLVQGSSTDEVGACAFRTGVMLTELSPHGRSLEQRFLDWTSDSITPGDPDTTEHQTIPTTEELR